MVIYTTIIQIEINNEIIPVHQNNSREKVKWWLVTTVLLLSWFFSSWRFCQCSLKRHHLQHTVGFSCWISHQSRSQLEKVSGRTGICATMWTERAAALSETGVQVWHPHISSALSRLMKGCEDPTPPTPPLRRWCVSRGLSLTKDWTDCDRRLSLSAYGCADLGSSSVVLCFSVCRDAVCSIVEKQSGLDFKWSGTFCSQRCCGETQITFEGRIFAVSTHQPYFLQIFFTMFQRFPSFSFPSLVNEKLERGIFRWYRIKKQNQIPAPVMVKTEHPHHRSSLAFFVCFHLPCWSLLTQHDLLGLWSQNILGKRVLEYWISPERASRDSETLEAVWQHWHRSPW